MAHVYTTVGAQQQRATSHTTHYTTYHPQLILRAHLLPLFLFTFVFAMRAAALTKPVRYLPSHCINAFIICNPFFCCGRGLRSTIWMGDTAIPVVAHFGTLVCVLMLLLLLLFVFCYGICLLLLFWVSVAYFSTFHYLNFVFRLLNISRTWLFLARVVVIVVYATVNFEFRQWLMFGCCCWRSFEFVFRFVER